MDHPAVGRRHRVELDGPAAGDGSLGHAPCQRCQLPGSPLAVLLDVQHDAGGAAFASPEREVHEELKGSEGFAAVTDEQTGVVALDVDDGHLFAAAGAADGRHRLHVHPVEEALHDAERDSGGTVSVGDAPDADPGIL